VQVVIRAMRAGGFAGSKEQANAFFTEYRKAWEEMLRAKVAEVEAEEAQAAKAPGASSIPSQEPEAPPVESKVEVLPKAGKASKPAKKTRLLRGELRQMAEKEPPIETPGKTPEKMMSPKNGSAVVPKPHESSDDVSRNVTKQ